MPDLEHVRRALDKSPRPCPPFQPELFMPAMPPLGLIAALENRWYAWQRRRSNIQARVPDRENDHDA